MNDNSFKALVVSETNDGTYTRKVTDRSIEDLPEGEVLIQVHYSSLNYKDGLSCIGNRGVTRNYPHTPGIDASGEVVESSDSRFRHKDNVLVTGYDLGMNTSGGFGQYIRVPADWVVPLPEGLSHKESMIYGTAGFTAALSVHALLKHGITPEQGEIVVTGSTGGVGSISVLLLSNLGYDVVASTGKSSENNFLKGLGAKEIVARDVVNDDSKKPLLKQRWAGGIDTVGDTTLATLLKSTIQRGAVATTGNVASANLPITVYPFILRGVSLLGIDSGQTPMNLRCQIWKKLASEWKFPQLKQLSVDCDMDNLEPEIVKILEGGQRGRVVVNLQ